MASLSQRISTRVVVDNRPGKESTVTVERYRARYRDETGKEHARHFARKANAQRWLDEVTAAVVRGGYVDPAAGKVTFGQWFRRWSEVQTWTDGTAETATMMLASVTFADVPMSRVAERHVEAWMKAMTKPGPKRKKGLAASTRRTRYNDVRMAFLRRTLSIRRQIRGQVNSQTVEVSPKYESARTVDLPDDLVRVLAAHLEKCPPMGEEGWLFSLNGYAYNRTSAGNQWRSLRAKVGRDAFSLHDLRHFFASGPIADGCDVVTVQHAVGHSSASVTLNVYSRLLARGGGPHQGGRRRPDGGHGRLCGLCADSGRFLSVNQR